MTDGSVAKTAQNPNGALQFMGTGAQPNVSQQTVEPRGSGLPQCLSGAELHARPRQQLQSHNHNFKLNRTVIENWDDWDIRGDYIIDTKNSLFVRFSSGHSNADEHYFLRCSSFGLRFRYPISTTPPELQSA